MQDESEQRWKKKNLNSCFLPDDVEAAQKHDDAICDRDVCEMFAYKEYFHMNKAIFYPFFVPRQCTE